MPFEHTQLAPLYATGGVGPVVDLQNVWATGTRIAREDAANGGGGGAAGMISRARTHARVRSLVVLFALDCEEEELN